MPLPLRKTPSKEARFSWSIAHESNQAECASGGKHVQGQHGSPWEPGDFKYLGPEEGVCRKGRGSGGAHGGGWPCHYHSHRVALLSTTRPLHEEAGVYIVLDGKLSGHTFLMADSLLEGNIVSETSTRGSVKSEGDGGGIAITVTFTPLDKRFPNSVVITNCTFRHNQGGEWGSVVVTILVG